MASILALLLMLFGLAAPTLAWPQPLILDAPLARRIASTAWHESATLGPFDAQVSIFSVPESDGKGERLYVGLVDDLFDRDSRVRIWRGPVATGWSTLGPVPERNSRRSAPNPARYLVTRKGLAPDGQDSPSLMEIDLEASSPCLKFVDAISKKAALQEALPLDEILPLNESMRLLPRLHDKKAFTAGKQQLASYKMTRGDVRPSAKRPLEVKDWESPMESHLLLVTMRDNPDSSAVFFLPMRPFGWVLRQRLPILQSRNHQGRFALEMFADYLVPDADGSLMLRSSRHLVTAGMDGMSVTTLDTGYVYDVGREMYEKEKPTMKPLKR